MSTYVGQTACGHAGCGYMVCNSTSTVGAFDFQAREQAPNSNRAARRRAIHAAKVERRHRRKLAEKLAAAYPGSIAFA